MPSDLLGNIGESLDHGQSRWLDEDELDEREEAADGSEAGPGANMDSAGPVSEPSGAWQEYGSSTSVGTSGAVAGSSGAFWDDNGRASAVPSAGTSGARSDEVGDAPQASGYTGGADSRVDNLTEEVRFTFCSCCCSSRRMTLFFAGAEDQC